jgi:DNA-binding IclR family transcriptional regulator
MIATVEIIGPEQRMTEGSIPRYIKQVKEAAAEIEKKMDFDIYL